MITIRSILVDDEKSSRTSLKKLLKAYPQIEIIDEASDGVEAVEKIEAAKPDLIFLDIQMPGLNGFDVLRTLTVTPPPKVVFVTAYDQYAVKAFEVNAIDYLLKPIDERRLRLTIGKIIESGRVKDEEYERIRKLLQQLNKSKLSLPHLPLRRGKKIILMNPSEIHFLKSEQGVTIVVTGKAEQGELEELAGSLRDEMP